jgi:hypothetical protein
LHPGSFTDIVTRYDGKSRKRRSYRFFLTRPDFS